MFCSHMHTYTRTGKEEYNDTSKKKREKNKREEKKSFSVHRETEAIEVCYYFFCVRKHSYSFVSLFWLDAQMEPSR